MNPLNPLYIAVAWVMTQIHAGLSSFLPSTSGEAWFLTIILLVVRAHPQAATARQADLAAELDLVMSTLVRRQVGALR